MLEPFLLKKKKIYSGGKKKKSKKNCNNLVAQVCKTLNLYLLDVHFTFYQSFHVRISLTHFNLTIFLFFLIKQFYLTALFKLKHRSWIDLDLAIPK